MLWLNGLIGDLNYGLRMMRNARLVSIAVTVTLTVGIGINTGIFTIINGMLLRPRTDSNPETLPGSMRNIGHEETQSSWEDRFLRRRIEPFRRALDHWQNWRRGARTTF